LGSRPTVDLGEGRFYGHREIMDKLADSADFSAWVKNITVIDDLLKKARGEPARFDKETLRRRQVAAGLSMEDLELVLQPMVEHAKEGVGSMGDDTPHAVLSAKERPLFHYFKQRFAEVTNPPIDHLREGFVFSLRTLLGPRGNALEELPGHARLLELPSPVLTEEDVAAIRRWGEREAAFASVTLDAVFPRADEGPLGRAHSPRRRTRRPRRRCRGPWPHMAA
jgi:glutamate synthase (NADPH/NADH) large chain